MLAESCVAPNYFTLNNKCYSQCPAGWTSVLGTTSCETLSPIASSFIELIPHLEVFTPDTKIEYTFNTGILS